MYETHFGWTGLPFQLSPDPTFYFASRSRSRALDDLRAVLELGAGFIVLGGEVGAGKTTLVRALIDSLEVGRFDVAQLVSTQLNPDQLISAIAIAFGVRTDPRRPDAHAGQLLGHLLQARQRAKGVLLVIDEAQHLGVDGMQRLLALMKCGARRVSLRICLVGQPGLLDTIAVPALADVRRRMLLSGRLGPIAPDETGAYIEHRLRKVGWSGTPDFAPGAFDAIHRSSRGIPRRINVLCNRLLLSRFLEAESTIDSETVVRVASELDSELCSMAPMAVPERRAIGKYPRS